LCQHERRKHYSFSSRGYVAYYFVGSCKMISSYYFSIVSRFLLSFFAFGFFSLSFAGVSYKPSGGTVSPYSPTSWPSGRSSSLDAVTNATILSDVIEATIANKAVQIAATRSISASAAVALGVKAIPIIGQAATAYSIYSAVRCKFESLAFLCDDGVSPPAPPTSGWYVLYVSPRLVYATAEAACKAQIARTYPGDSRIVFESVDGGYCLATNNNYSPPWRGMTVAILDQGACVSSGCLDYQAMCSGGQSVGPDGKCPGGVKSVKSVDDVAAKIAPYVSPSKLPSMVKDAAQAGIDISPAWVVKDATGPAFVQSPAVVSTSTSPDGTKQTSTSTDTTKITYSGDNFTTSVTNVTTINNSSGTTTVVTDNVDKQKTDCEKNPNAVGCIDLGEPESVSPQWKTKDVLYQADSLGLPAACPAPWVGTVHGWNLSFSYSPLCDNAAAIRAGVLVIAGLSALFLIITTVKS
jgi:hypothetical protein